MADVLVSTSTWQGASYEVDHAAVRHLVVERMLATGDELRDIARNAGISRMSLWRFLKGRPCSLRTVSRVLRALGAGPSMVVRLVAGPSFQLSAP
jgi:DNA-binding phage protein